MGGRCLGIEDRSVPHPIRGDYSVLAEFDPETGARFDVARIAGSPQWLPDSVVFVSPMRVDATSVCWEVVRYWPAEGRRETLLSLPWPTPLR